MTDYRPSDLQDHAVARYCGRQVMDENFRPTHQAFALKSARDEQYLSVFSLDIAAPDEPREDQIRHVRIEINAVRNPGATARLAVLVARPAFKRARREIEGANLTIEHEPDDGGKSHCGIYGLKDHPEHVHIQRILAEAVEDMYPARVKDESED